MLHSVTYLNERVTIQRLYNLITCWNHEGELSYHPNWEIFRDVDCTVVGQFVV